MADAGGGRRMGVVMDPIGQIKPYKDTTLALMLAAQRAGWELDYMEPRDLWMRDGTAFCRRTAVQVFDDPHHWYELGASRETPLAELPVLLMRKDPPFDLEYVMCTYMLEHAEAAGTLVLNRPASLRDCNEKAFIAWFPHCCTPTLMSRDMQRLRAFHAEHGDVVFKPVDGMGGSGVLRIGEDGRNLAAAIELLTDHGRRTIVAQRYLREIANGDKRVLMIDGEPVEYGLARLPAPGEVRGNLAAGGRGEARPLTDREAWIAQQVGPELRRRGLVFVGLDIIGDYLTEINVTSPTCAREIDAAFNTDIGGRVMQAIDRRLHANR